MKNMIEDFTPQGGMHCITNSLKQIFTYYNHPISEEMMFGLASGLSFLYLNQATSPMISGRSKVFEFEEKLAQRLQIEIRCKAGKQYDKVFNITKAMIDQKKPVLIYVDMPYLKYLGLDENSHFGGHAVVVFGYDEDKQLFYVSDRDQHDSPIRTPKGELAMDMHLVPYEEMQRARTSTHRPFPASNKYLTFDFQNFRTIDALVLKEAIKETCESMLNPPAQLLGINGILKFAKEVKKWKHFDAQKLKLAGLTNYFQISEDGGTGGGIFRKMYGSFLIEAAAILEEDQAISIGEKFHEVASLWDEVAKDLWQLSLRLDQSLLTKISNSVLNIYELERNLYTSLLHMVREA